MHLIDLAVDFLGCVPIVGSTIPIGVGAAFGAMLQERSPLTVIFFGDAATETGVFHESVNFAAVHRLPVLFVCENNLYSVNTPLRARQPANRTIAELAARPRHRRPAATTARKSKPCMPRLPTRHRAISATSGGPALLEFVTYRWLEHCGPLGDVAARIPPASRSSMPGSRAARSRCIAKLLEHDGVHRRKPPHAAIEAAIAEEIDDAVAFARASPFPARSGARPPHVRLSSAPRMISRQLKFAEAVHEAIDLCLARDRRTYRDGPRRSRSDRRVRHDARACRRSTARKRVLDMPVAENAMTGVALGSCLVGMRPIMTHMRLEFAMAALEQICNQAAKWHYMFGGQSKVPLTIRMIDRPRLGPGRRSIRRACTRGSRTCPASRSSCRRRRTTPRDC